MQQNRRNFRPAVPPLDQVWTKAAATASRSRQKPVRAAAITTSAGRGSAEPRRPARPNVRIDASELESASKAKRLSASTAAQAGATPTPPPMVVAPAEIDAPRSLVEAPPSSRSRRKRRRARLSWAALFVAIALFVVGSFGDGTRLRQARVRATGALSDLLAQASTQIEARLRGEAKPARVVVATVEPPAPTFLKLNRAGHVSIPGGILVLPSSFETSDGAYDLLIHFHGNTAVVKESVEVAKLNAAVAIINVGIGSGPYEEYYAQPGTYEELLADIDHGLRQRGVTNAHLRRVALSAWSAGYGAVSTILHVRKKTDPLDAVLLLDGIHCSWEGASSATFIAGGGGADPSNMNPELAAARSSGAINTRQLGPFVEAAKEAADGRIYFGITHSEIDPITYVSTSVASNYLVKSVGAENDRLDPERDAPKYVELESMANAVDHSKEKTMEPTTEARKGCFHVIGYKGETQEHHMAHLFEMSQTLLPELVERWAPPDAPPSP